MKKRILAALILITAAYSYSYSATGTAVIAPAYIAPSAYHPVITVTYKAAPGVIINSGAVALQVNSGFSPAPSNVTTNAGAITAVIMVNGTTPTDVPQSDITVDGYAVTINSITMQTADSLIITYGGTGSGGLYGPSATGAYPFYVSEEISSTDPGFTNLSAAPVIYVSNMVISKSTLNDMIEAGNTVTYILSYQNKDAGNNMTGVLIMDSMPQGLLFQGAQPSPTNFNGNIYTWNIGSVVSAGGGSTITITAVAQAGIAAYGFTSTNYATISGSSISSGTNGMAVSSTVNVSGAVLSSSISASPATVVSGGIITAVMNITNAGNLNATGVTPLSPLSMSGSGTAVLQSTPSPSSISPLAPNSSGSFTWTYLAGTAGTITFSSHYYADDNGQAIPNSNISSNNVLIQNPTPTFTFTPVPPTDTPTPQYTSTPVVTNTPAATDTPAGTATTVPTQATSPTAVSTMPAITPTPVPTITVKAVTDRNYISLGSGDRAAIIYKVESDGDSWIDIYNLNGELVKHFNRAPLAAGQHTVYWDGSNDDAKKVGQGMYFIVIHQPGGVTTKKLIVIK